MDGARMIKAHLGLRQDGLLLIDPKACQEHYFPVYTIVSGLKIAQENHSWLPRGKGDLELPPKYDA